MGDFNSYFSSIPKMETERLIFTAFTREDMNAYFEILRDKDVQRYLGGGVPLFDKEPHISNWLNNINDKLLKRKLVFTWCIREKRSNQVIGRIDLGGFIKKQNAEISYHFAKAFWGWIFRCGGAACPVWREPPVRTDVSHQHTLYLNNYIRSVSFRPYTSRMDRSFDGSTGTMSMT